MGSEGYFINEFVAPHTNQRDDDWGGTFANRMRLPVEIVRRTREAVGPRLHHHLPRCRCSTWSRAAARWDEVVALAQGDRGAPAPRSSTPASAGTRRASRPSRRWCRAPRSRGSRGRLKGEVRHPADRDQPHQRSRRLPSDVLARRRSPTWSRWRGRFSPMPSSSRKAAAGRADEINTCIACNQACLDQIFERKVASCLVNPRACHETELVITRPRAPKRDRRRRRRACGARVRDDAPAEARARGDAVRCVPRRSAASSTWPSAFPARRSSHETLRYYRRELELAQARRCWAVRLKRPDLTSGISTKSSSLQRPPARPRDSGPRTSESHELRRRAAPRRSPSAPRSRSWAPGSDSTSPSS